MTGRSGSAMIIAGAAKRSLVKPPATAARAEALGDHLPASTTGQGGSVTSWRQQSQSGASGALVVKGERMSGYRVTESIGTRSTSWEDAAAEAIRTSAGTLRDLREAEVVKQDNHLDEGGAITYRTKLQLSFKYEPDH